MGLATGRVVFKKTVDKWLTPPTGMIYRAAKEAYAASMADQVIYHQGKLIGGNGQLDLLKKYNKEGFFKIMKILGGTALKKGGKLLGELGGDLLKNMGKSSGVIETYEGLTGFGSGKDNGKAARSLIIGINKLRKTGLGLYKSGKEAHDQASIEASAANIEGVGSSSNSNNSNNSADSNNNVGRKTFWGVTKKAATDTVIPGAAKAIRSKTGASQAWGGTVSKIAPALLAVVKQQDAQDLIDVGDTLARLIESQRDMDKLKEQKSEAFAKAFCDSLEKSLFPLALADAISKYIKSMDMTITSSTFGALVAGAIPVAGVFTISTALPTTKLVIW